MPNGICPDDGLSRTLFRILVNPDTELVPWSALLFTNDYTPDESTVLADLTEPTFAGYSRRSVDPATWTAPALVGHYAKSSWGSVPLEWTNGGAVDVTVYGYALYDSLFSRLVLVERFDPDDIRAVAPGDTIKVLPVFSHRSQSATE